MISYTKLNFIKLNLNSLLIKCMEEKIARMWIDNLGEEYNKFKTKEVEIQ